MKLALINDTDGRENIGCRLTSSLFKSALMRAARRQGTELAIVSCPWKFREHCTPALPWTSLSLMLGTSVLSSRVLRELSMAEYGRNTVKSVEAADVVVYQPEGTISDDDTPLRIMRQLCLPLYASVCLKKPLAIANGTFPLFDDVRRELLDGVVALSRAACFRDRRSAEHYDGRFCPDAAFAWAGAAVPDDTRKRPYVLITTGAHVPIEVDRTLCRKALEWCRARGCQPLIMTKAWERLEPFRRETLSLGGRFVESVTLAQADEILDRVRLHVGGRYHVAIMCATKGIPSWLIPSNTHKNSWLAEEVRGISMVDRADAELDAYITEEAIPAPKVVTDSVAPLADLFASTVAGLMESLGETASGQATATDPEAWPGDRWPSKLRAALRGGYFRDSGLSLLRASGLR